MKKKVNNDGDKQDNSGIETVKRVSGDRKQTRSRSRAKEPEKRNNNLPDPAGQVTIGKPNQVQNVSASPSREALPETTTSPGHKQDLAPSFPGPGQSEAPEAPVLGRPIWSGTLSIGLVNVAVTLHAMTVDHSFPLHLLHREDHQPIRYERVCSHDGSVVPWEEIVKGYEFRKGHFVVLDRDELAAAMPESDRKIHIEKFVHYIGLDPMYFTRSYILAPGRDPEAYHLLHAAFEQEGKAGVGRFTLRTREYPVVIHAYRGGLVLTTLRYADEVLLPASFPDILAGLVPSKRDLDLAVRIISDLTGDFDVNEFHDRARDNIWQLIRKKMAGETFVVERQEEAAPQSLQQALEETLARLKAMEQGNK